VSRHRTVARTALVLLPLQVVFRAVDAAFPVLLALWFGRTELTDVYYFTWAVFALAGSLVFSAFQDSAVVPVLAELRLAQPSSLTAVRGSLLAHTLVLAGGLAAFFGAVAAVWFDLHYSGPARTAALWMIVPFALYLVALSVKTFFAAMLNAEHRYLPLPFASALGALVTVAFIAAERRSLSVVAVPVGALAGELGAVATLVASARAAGISFALTFARPEPVRRIARLVASEVGGGAITRVNPVIDQLMAGLTGVVGGGTLLKLSGDVASVPTSLLQASLLPVLLTHLSEDFAARDVARLRSTLRRTLVSVLAILGCASAALWLASEPLTRLLFAHGAMDARGAARVAHLLAYHLAGLVPFGALLVLARAHVAIQNSRIMLSMGLLNAGLNAALNAALVRPLGHEGIALATSVTYAVVAVVFAVRLRARLSAALPLEPRAAKAA
jgi:putative peptidoglycan lipid II flippase